MEILNLALTIILFLISLFLILLVLVQLPKKEAGLGTAFGGGTTDALFGAGTGNVLTKLTKYSTIIFLVLCLVLSVMNKRDRDKTNTAGTDKGKDKKEQTGQDGTGLGTTGTTGGTTTGATTPVGPQSPPPSTNAPAPVPSTNSPASSTNAPAPEEAEGEEKKN